MEIVYHANGAAVEGLADRNGHIWKVVGEGKSVSWGGARTKGKGRECKLTKTMFLHSDMLIFCLKKNTTPLSSSLTQLRFTIKKLCCKVMGRKYGDPLTNQMIIYTVLTYNKPYRNIFEHF